MILPIVLLIILFLVFGAVLIYYALKWKDRKQRNHPAPPEVVARDNPPDNGAGNPPDPPHQNIDADVPLEAVAHGNPPDNGAGDPPDPPHQNIDADVPLEAVAHGNPPDNGAGDPPDPPHQNIDADVPLEAVAHGNPPDNGASDPPAPLLEDDDDDAPFEVIVHDNQQEDDIIGDHAPVMDVPLPGHLPFEANGIGSLLSVSVAPGHGANMELAMPIPADNVSLSNAQFVARYAAGPGPQVIEMECATGENLPSSQEERNYPSQEQQQPEECTDRNASCRPEDAILRKASMSSGDFQNSRPWLQHPASSSNRATSEASVCLLYTGLGN